MGDGMKATDLKDVDLQRREGRLNRRVAVAGIVVSAVAAITAAVVTAHSTTITQFLGGPPASAGTPSPDGGTITSSRTASPRPTGIQLPSGQAFTKGSFTISDSGVDLDRNPVEAGNVSNGESEIIAEYPTGLYFYGAQETVQWKQPGLPTQRECHSAELSDGQAALNFDLTSIQQSRQQDRFCILTSEGRDAYVVISGSKVVSGSPFPAQTFVWASKIPVN
jgi:hypothetical protein